VDSKGDYRVLEELFLDFYLERGTIERFDPASASKGEWNIWFLKAGVKESKKDCFELKRVDPVLDMS